MREQRENNRRELAREQKLQRMRERLLQQERLCMLGELAASMAHDLAGSLRMLSMRAEAVRKGGRGWKRHLAALEEGLRYAQQRVDPLQTFARLGSAEMSAIQLERIVRAAAAAATDVRGHPLVPRMRVELDLPSLPLVRGSPAEVSHLFLNLLLNARDSMPKGGTVKVIGRARGSEVRVQVVDNGEGVKREHLPYLFEPFFTTKGARGTGLGLWIAATTMRRIGGSIAAERRKRGMAFVVTFPVAQVSRRAGARGG
jgi:signal transduction histidine kinase